MEIANFVIITVILLVLCVFFGIFFFMWHKEKKKRAAMISDEAEKSSDKKIRAKWLEKIVDNALKSLNCQTEWITDHGDRIVKYDYQNGHFRIRVEQGSSYVNLSYLFCYTTTTDKIDVARIVCNQCNLNTCNERLVYSINEKKNEIDIHVLVGLLVNKDNAQIVLVNAMRDIFNWQNAFAKRFDELTTESQKTGETDHEFKDAQLNRMVFLLRQQEMDMQHGDQLRFNKTNTLSLGLFMDKALGITEIIPHRLSKHSDNNKELSDFDEILGLDLFNPSNKILSFRFETGKLPQKEQRMMIMVNDAGDDGQTEYKRILACVEPVEPPSNMPFAFSKTQPQAKSVLVAYDHTSPQAKINEFNYMWKEALQKYKNGEEDSLTEEQQIICQCTDTDTALSLYEGKKLFLSKRYFEALLHLENAFQRMQPRFDSMKNAEKDKFFEVIYLIGFCYSEMRQYKMAMGYLDMISGIQRVNYTEEIVNCMINSGDFRSLTTVDNLLRQLTPDIDGDDEEEIPPHIQHFLSFLNRRKAYLLVDKRRFDEAKKLLNDMLEDPENADFAINELAFIQRLEKERDENAETTDEG